MRRIILFTAAIIMLTATPAIATTPNTLPVCPPVSYDGVLPQDGGTGPVWHDGPPLSDCTGDTPSTTTTVPPAVLGPATVLERPLVDYTPAVVVEVTPEFTG